MLHLFSGPANKKDGLKAMIVERATRSEALRGVKVAVQEVDLHLTGTKARSEECDLLRDDVFRRPIPNSNPDPSPDPTLTRTVTLTLALTPTLTPSLTASRRERLDAEDIIQRRTTLALEPYP